MPPGKPVSATLTSYKYIVIGGDTAGCVIAFRLSQGSDAGALLAESGSEEQLREIAAPAAWPGFGTELYELGRQHRGAPSGTVAVLLRGLDGPLTVAPANPG